MRVVDRRWWARKEDGAEAGDTREDSGVRKPTYVEGLERQLADQQAQLQSVIVEHRKSLDEFEEARVRIRRDVTREVERGKRAVLVELLEVVDNLDRAVSAAQAGMAGRDSGEALENLARGIRLVRDQFLAKLAGMGVTRIEALGLPFDAMRHEAVTTTPVEAEQDGFVVAVTKEGYAIGDEILRPASVVVGTLG
jgi:molecular chaperone GrpE